MTAECCMILLRCCGQEECHIHCDSMQKMHLHSQQCCLLMWQGAQHRSSALNADAQGGMSQLWRQQRKHVFILSNAGKPIWTLHGDENALAGLMAVIQALTSFVHDKGDAMQSIRYRFCKLQAVDVSSSHFAQLLKTGWLSLYLV